MSLWRHITHGLKALRNRSGADRDVADEIEHFLDQASIDLETLGLPPAEARRTARVQMGSLTSAREEVRESGWESTLERLYDDTRYALRRLLHKPGFTTASVLTLALGIGGTTAIFSIINGDLLKPLPYSDPDRLVALWHTAPGVNLEECEMGPSQYFVYSDETRTFEDVSLWGDGRATVTGLAEPEEVTILLVTNRLLPILRVPPALGRTYNPTDEIPASPGTVILTDSYWKARLGGDRSAVGRSLTIDGNPYEVIGVLPPSFQFMDRRVSLLMLMRFDRAKTNLGNFSYNGLGRLKPGITIEQASADIRRMQPIVYEKFPAPSGYSKAMFLDARVGPNLKFLKQDLVGDIQRTLWVLMGTLGLVLLIACANVANLHLVRTEGRHQELALRAALGAGRARLACELLLESVLLGVFGGTLGLVLANGALRWLTASELARIPRIDNISIDPAVLAFTVGISLLSGIGFGLIPAWRYARPGLFDGLRGSGRTHSQSRERHRTRSILVVVQVALALVLLVSSGLMIRTFRALRNVDPGFSGADQLLTVRVSIPETQVKEPQHVLRTHQDILRRICEIAGVSSAAIINALPMTGGSNDPIYAQDRVYAEGSLPPIRRFKFVSPGFFSTARSRLVAGRDITWEETVNYRRVALVSENLARELWSDPRSALGKRIRTSLKEDWTEVIGVVADVYDNGVDRNAPSIVYWPLLRKESPQSQVEVSRSVTFVLRTARAGHSALLDEVRQAIAGVNGNLPLANVRTLQQVYDRSLARTSFTLTLLAIAGAVALLLGVIGIYGVISYAVSQRTREIGIRIALGAPLRQVTRMFVQHGLLLSAIGVVCGLTGAFALTRLLRSLLFGVSPADPPTYLAASVCLVIAATLASYLPARRTMKVDPAITLRAE
jgi:predicted permease